MSRSIDAMNSPNVLFILTDQHRHDCLGAAGNSQIRTPALDGLAADGTRFENSFCPFPVCTPSRYSMISGLYVHQHCGWTNRCTLAPGVATFPRLMREAGYRTACVGKMHYTPTYLDVGFDSMLLSEQAGDGRWDDDYHCMLRDRGLTDAIDVIDQRREYRDRAQDEYWDSFGAQRSNLPEELYSTTWIGDHAVAELERWEGTGNLLFASFIKPHHPFDPPAPWDEMYSPDQLEPFPGWTEETPTIDLDYSRGYFPNDRLTLPALQRVIAHYFATISQIDHHVGRMIEVLKRKGLYEDTLILFTSDHGDFMGFHHMILKGNHMYDPLVKVPLIVKWPGNANGGSVCDTLVSNVDLPPTILQQVGIDPPRAMQGLDLSAPDADRPWVFCESNRCYMIRTRTRKLLVDRQPQHCQFFDLDEDPLELCNLYEERQHQSEIADLHAQLADWLMFNSKPPVYVDPDAPVISAENVPDCSDDHRQQMADYFWQKTEPFMKAE